MFASMYAADGIGLAANQIGIGLRGSSCTTARATTEDERLVGHVVNPVLAAPKGRAHRQVDSEGCLSVPGPYADLGRADIATITGLRLTGAARSPSAAPACWPAASNTRSTTWTGSSTLTTCPRKRRKAVLAAAGL